MRFTPEHFSTAAQAQSVPELFSIYEDRQCKKFFSTGWGWICVWERVFLSWTHLYWDAGGLHVSVWRDIRPLESWTGWHILHRERREIHMNTPTSAHAVLCALILSAVLYLLAFVHFCWVVHESCVACMCLMYTFVQFMHNDMCLS